MSRDFSTAKIYKITNDYNEDVYIGSTCDSIHKRFTKHTKAINESRKELPL